MDQGEADEEVASGDPAFGDDVLPQKGNDDGAATENDSSGEVHVGEETVEQRRRREDAAEDEDDDEGDEEDDDQAESKGPSHGG